jgi:TIR domain/SIR2-like domain
MNSPSIAASVEDEARTESGVMRSADWTSLVHAVEHGKCTLMLGPDAVSGTLDGERLPVHVALARFVKDRLGPKYAHLDPYKPASVAQAAVAQEDPFTLQGWVEEFYEQFVGDFDMLRDLAALPFELIINSSPGLSVQKVFLEQHPRTHSDFYDRTGRARPTLPDFSADAPLVYHLFGSLEEPASLILTDIDRLDFLIAVVSDNPPLPPKLKSALRDSERSMLFVGFQLAQWQFRLLLHVLSHDSPRRYKSFAFEPGADPFDDDTVEFYRSGYRIHFISGDLPAFARELRTRVRIEPAETIGVGDGDGRTAPALPPGAPVVFLCHSNDDKAFAAQLSDGLQANGIETWLDKDDIAGGDQWDEIVRSTIKHRVDYVVVLQSESLIRKQVGYVNREIELALDRQLEYRPPRRFVIPVVIDDPANRLEHLSDLQSVDLTQPRGIDDLVRVINRDRSLEARAGR